MRITKIGHSCLFIEEKDARILIDPGSFSTLPAFERVDALLLTHEHQDHFDLAAIKGLLRTHPSCEVITHASLQRILEGEGLAATLIDDGATIEKKGVMIVRIGNEHACIHPELPLIENCGFMIGDLFYPGDSFVLPERKVKTLALPVAAPWMRLEECVEYARKVAPEAVFPVHDGMLRPDRMTPTRRIPAMLLERSNIRYVDMMEGWSEEF
jgi:L-ascorbate metabolism protein UlaG (beta-lactamase superfamily)